MSGQHEPPSGSRIILIGDHDTTAEIDRLQCVAADHTASIIEVHGYPPAEPHISDDLTDVEAVVQAVGSAIAQRAFLWVPYPGQDIGREQHLRHLSLALQRHGLNLLVGPALAACPTEGGLSPADYALREEVRAVDSLDRAALAAAAVSTLGTEIEMELARAVPARAPFEDQPEPSDCRALATPGDGAGDMLTRLRLELARRLESRFGPAPVLPSPDTPWPARQPALKEYALWLVSACHVTQSKAADLLNALGQRTKQGRQWQRANLSALVNGRYDGGIAA